MQSDFGKFYSLGLEAVKRCREAKEDAIYGAQMDNLTSEAGVKLNRQRFNQFLTESVAEESSEVSTRMVRNVPASLSTIWPGQYEVKTIDWSSNESTRCGLESMLMSDQRRLLMNEIRMLGSSEELEKLERARPGYYTDMESLTIHRLRKSSKTYLERYSLKSQSTKLKSEAPSTQTEHNIQWSVSTLASDEHRLINQNCAAIASLFQQQSAHDPTQLGIIERDPKEFQTDPRTVGVTFEDDLETPDPVLPDYVLPEVPAKSIQHNTRLWIRHHPSSALTS